MSIIEDFREASVKYRVACVLGVQNDMYPNFSTYSGTLISTVSRAEAIQIFNINNEISVLEEACKDVIPFPEAVADHTDAPVDTDSIMKGIIDNIYSDYLAGKVYMEDISDMEYSIVSRGDSFVAAVQKKDSDALNEAIEEFEESKEVPESVTPDPAMSAVGLIGEISGLLNSGAGDTYIKEGYGSVPSSWYYVLRKYSILAPSFTVEVTDLGWTVSFDGDYPSIEIRKY